MNVRKQTADLSTSSREIVVASAADDGYVLPLAVTIRSTLDHLAFDRRIRLFILDGGISEPNRERLENSWRDNRLTIEWIKPDLELVHDLKVSEHINAITYFRLLLPRLLPTDVDRVIYFDADLLIRRDISALWDEAQGEHAVLAVQDVAAPWIDAYVSLPNFAACQRHICAVTPVANYRHFGIRADAKYFNGGMLVVNLDQWRRKNYAQQMLDCLRQHRDQVLWWDQYALNAILAGQWRSLDLRWNQGAHIFMYPSAGESPFESETLRQIRIDPWIVHFCSPSKPWHPFCHHPFTRSFYRCLERTDWHGWRPERPADYWHQWWNFHYRPLQKKWKTNVRAAKQYIRGKRRAA